MSNNITINLYNATPDRDLYLLAFQKPEAANPNEMYDTLFPAAWRVVPLGPGQTAEPLVYPIDLQVIATESQPVWNAKSRKTTMSTNLGQVWDFSINGDFSTLTPTSLKGIDGLVGVRNQSGEKIDAGLAKNGSTLVIQKGIAQGEQANFKLMPKMYFLFSSNILVSQGDLIRSDVMESSAYILDLTNLASVDLTIATADTYSGKLAWVESNVRTAS